jgi:hypothetical protein
VQHEVGLARDAEAGELLGKRLAGFLPRRVGAGRGLLPGRGQAPRRTITASTSMRAPRGRPATW